MSDLHFITYEDPKAAKNPSNIRAVKSKAARHHWARDAATRATRPKRRKRTQTAELAVRSRAEPVDEEVPYFYEPNELFRGLIGPLGAGRVDPFRTYPVEWKPDFPELVDHYIMNIAIRVPRLDVAPGEPQLRTVWFPLAMTNASTFSTVLLISASHLSSKQSSKRPDIMVRLLTLKEQAIVMINEALNDPSRSYSDAVIGAVVKLCCYEAIYDDKESYLTHMKGLQSMVAARGGLAQLGLNGLLRRICIWIDLKSAALNGTPLFFEDSVAARNALMALKGMDPVASKSLTQNGMFGVTG